MVIIKWRVGIRLMLWSTCKYKIQQMKVAIKKYFSNVIDIPCIQRRATIGLHMTKSSQIYHIQLVSPNILLIIIFFQTLFVFIFLSVICYPNNSFLFKVIVLSNNRWGKRWVFWIFDLILYKRSFSWICNKLI